MEYVSLYRRWRPQKFAEVVGQRHVVLTLQRAIAQGRVGHAYLFAGPRGTGKTTVARILAKALNCRQGPAPEPCLGCDVCQAIAAGSCLDVIEMDAASNRGVDEVRHLRENVGLAPAQGRTRVYIIDEVHMLTTEAFNALLKTLEEPPPHVLFVLATTEPHRLPLTITSRCQRFEFRRLDTREMVARLKEVAAREGIPASDDALGAVARYAEGSLRDAISLLDQLTAYSAEGITQETVWAVLGRAPLEMLSELGRALAGGDAVQVLSLIDEASARGLDMRQVLRDLAAYLRDLSVLATCGDGASLLYLPPGEVARARGEAGQFPVERWWELATGLARAEGEVRWTSQPRLALELALLRLVADRVCPSATAPAVQTTGPATPTTASGTPTATPAVAAVTGAPVAAPSAPAASPEAERRPGAGALSSTDADADERRAGAGALDSTRTGPGPGPGAALPAEAVWQRVLAALNRAGGRSRLAGACLREGRVLGLQGRQFVVGFGPQFTYHREQLEHQHRQLVERALADVLGYECRLVCRELSEEQARPTGAREPGEAGPGTGGGHAGVAEGGPGAAEVARGKDGRGTEIAAARDVAANARESGLDEVVQRAWREWGGYILDLEREDAP